MKDSLDDLEQTVGKPLDGDLVAKLKPRIHKRGTFHTADFKPNRLNAHVDDDNRIVKWTRG